MPSKHASSRARRVVLTTTACSALTFVAALAAAGAPLSAAAASSPAAVFASPASTADAASALPIETLSTSADEAQRALDGARDDLAAATTVSAEIAESGLDLGDTSLDTGELRRAIVDLAKAEVIPVLLFPDLADNATAQGEAVSARVAELRAALEAARAEKAAADAAAQAQREAEQAAAAEEAARASALAAANTPEGARAFAAGLAAERYGWGSGQFSCLNSLWQKESGWNYRAYNASSGATGIPQSLPGSKMATAGADWQTSAATQIAWGLDYISRAYGTPCAAWGKSRASNWY